MEAWLFIIPFLIVGYFWFRNTDRVNIDNKSNDATEFEIGGVKLKCIHCGHLYFYAGRAQLNTAFASFFGFDWANKESSYLSCEHCGFIHWFKIDPCKLSDYKSTSYIKNA